MDPTQEVLLVLCVVLGIVGVVRLWLSHRAVSDIVLKPIEEMYRSRLDRVKRGIEQAKERSKAYGTDPNKVMQEVLVLCEDLGADMAPLGEVYEKVKSEHESWKSLSYLGKLKKAGEIRKAPLRSKVVKTFWVELRSQDQ